MRRAGLFLALLLCFSPLASAQAQPISSPDPQSMTSEQKLNRLQAIFIRLEAISIQLDSKLATSEADLAKLSEELNALKAELSELKLKLAESEERSVKLEATLAKLEASLAKVEQSFADYRQSVEIKIAALGLKAARWKIAGYVGIAVGVSGLIYGLTR